MKDGRLVTKSRDLIWETAAQFREMSRAYGLLRGVDATRASRILDHVADVMSEAVAEYDGKK